MKHLNFLPILLLLVLFSFVQTTNAQYNEQKIYPANGVITDFFGLSVGISGDYAIIGAWGDDELGACSGAAYIYYNNEGIWEEYTKLFPLNGYENERFASRVAISGDYAVGTTTQHNSDRGAAYIFYNNAGTWEEQAFIEEPDVPTFSLFGSSVAIEDNNIIIGMRMWADELPGAAFIYNYNGTTWTQTVELVPSEAINGDHVGESVDISGDYVIVGAHGTDDAKGAAYIYKNIDETWTKIIRLEADDGVIEDYYGAESAISNDYAMVGSYKHNGRRGAVYVYENNDDIWTLSQKIIAPDAGINDDFGCDIDFNDEVLIIGARSDNASGTAYVYKNIDGTWTFFEKIIPSDGADGDDFGDGVAISGSNFIVGAQWCDIFGVNSGAAYMYSTLSPENDIVQFDVTEQIGNEIIDETEHTVTLEVPYGTNVTNLIPTIEISENATISPESGVSQDFTNPVEYTVVAQNEDQQIWTVTVVDELNNENDILSFDFNSIEEVSVNIDDVLHTVNIVVPLGTNVTQLTPEIIISVEATVFPESGISQDFTDSFEYTVTAENEDEQIWTVTVEIANNIDDLNSQFTIYPNPSTGIFTISNLSAFAKPESVEITDITGKIIFNSQFSIFNSQFSIQKKGIYFIKIQIKKGIYTEKIVIQ